jgi:uncharacterized protein YprB with RNaseH-like and TPR domain
MRNMQRGGRICGQDEKSKKLIVSLNKHNLMNLNKIYEYCIKSLKNRLLEFYEDF